MQRISYQKYIIFILIAFITSCASTKEKCKSGIMITYCADENYIKEKTQQFNKKIIANVFDEPIKNITSNTIDSKSFDELRLKLEEDNKYQGIISDENLTNRYRKILK